MTSSIPVFVASTSLAPAPNAFWYRAGSSLWENTRARALGLATLTSRMSSSPSPSGKKGSTNRNVDPVQMYIASISYRAGLPGHLQVLLLVQAHRQGLPKGVVMGNHQYTLGFVRHVDTPNCCATRICHAHLCPSPTVRLTY